MAASKDILFWSPRGQLLRKNRLIPVTNIAELAEYVLLPHNDEVIKPRALNTFLDGLAELGLDKRLIKNKKILTDLLEKEKVYRENGASRRMAGHHYLFMSTEAAKFEHKCSLNGQELERKGPNLPQGH